MSHSIQIGMDFLLASLIGASKVASGADQGERPNNLWITNEDMREIRHEIYRAIRSAYPVEATISESGSMEFWRRTSMTTNIEVDALRYSTTVEGGLTDTATSLFLRSTFCLENGTVA
jgi:hypothetical protein